MKVRVLALAALLVLHAGCTGQQRAGWQIGATLAEYQGQVLRIPGPGAERLQIEMGYDPALRHYVEQNSAPDYIYVESTKAVQLMFINDDRVVRFQRSAINPKSRAVIIDEIPLPLASMFTRADQARLADIRRSDPAVASSGTAH